MEKISKEQEKALKTAFDQIGLEKPSHSFLSHVMEVVEAKEKNVTPLISKKGWFLIVLVFATCLSLLIFYPKEGSAYFDMVFSYRTDFFQNLFQGFKISKTMVMGISLLGLFLLQLPFLIKMTGRERTF
ncbi:MAG: hypothetical protein AAGC43_06785 [Bacteroidota bacterium]